MKAATAEKIRATLIGGALAVPFVAIMLLISLVSLVWRAYAVAVLWRWFVVPTFGLPGLRLGTAAGLLLLASVITSSMDIYEHQNDKMKPWGILISGVILWPLIWILMGWLIRGWVRF